MTVVSSSPEQTRALGAQIGAQLQTGDAVLIEGVLGSGKTTFVQGLAAGMGIESPVTSPTFVLVHEYRGGKTTLFHLDPYRLTSAEEVVDIGFDEFLEQGVVVVEWAERLGPLTPVEHIRVSLSIAPDDSRKIILTPVGRHNEEVVAQIRRSEC